MWKKISHDLHQLRRIRTFDAHVCVCGMFDAFFTPKPDTLHTFPVAGVVAPGRVVDGTTSFYFHFKAGERELVISRFLSEVLYRQIIAPEYWDSIILLALNSAFILVKLRFTKEMFEDPANRPLARDLMMIMIMECPASLKLIRQESV